MEEQAPTQEITIDAEQPVKEATKDVGTFWERLDQVLQLNLQAAQMRERVDDLLEEFPDRVNNREDRNSFLFQPERLLISSNDDVQPPSFQTDPSIAFSYAPNTLLSQYFSQFRIRLKRALVNVKSIQMLSAVLPNVIQNIPDNSIIFLYYRLRNITNSIQGAWDDTTIYDAGDIVFPTTPTEYYVCQEYNSNVGPEDNYWIQVGYIQDAPIWNATTTYSTGQQVQYNGQFWQSTQNNNVNVKPGFLYWVPVDLPDDLDRPNYWDLNEDHLCSVYLDPTVVLPEAYNPATNPLLFNRTFQDYQDLLSSINFAATQGPNATHVNDISFNYDATLNKFIFEPQNIDEEYYYLPAGFEDPNVTSYLQTFGDLYGVPLSPGYTLNLRMGFTWNGRMPNPFEQNPYSNDYFPKSIYAFLRPIDPALTQPPYNLQAWGTNVVTANSYADLVNTSCVRIYCDCIFGSTQDSDNTNRSDAEGLLSVVPVATNNLGVAFYQNNFNNPLTKIPGIITEIGIRLVNDQGLPFYLPNSATCLLELGITYK